MKNFEYAAPRTEAGVLELLAEKPDRTEILAGGTDLVGLMKKMIVTPDRVVNIMDVPSLKSIEPTPEGGVSIGAAVTLDDVLASRYLSDYPAVTQAILGINSMTLQAQGTLGGELCQRPRCWFYRNGGDLFGHSPNGGHAVEAGDNTFHAIFGNSGPAKFVSSSRIAPALIVHGAMVRIVGPESDDERFVSVEDFFRTPRHEGQREIVLEPGQLLTHIVLPPAAGVSSATYEVRHGEGPDYPLASASAALSFNGAAVREARIVLGQVAPTPWIAQEAAMSLIGLPIDASIAEMAGERATERATPLSRNGYKVQLAKVAVKRALLLAAGLETGGF